MPPETILLTSCYLAPVAYYSHLYRARQAVIEVNDHYQKQSYRNRCVIAGANGPLTLSIPVVKPENGKGGIREVRIADYDNWRHLHWNAIRSAYNTAPFFQYYEDDFRPFYEKPYTFLHDFNEGLRQLVCRLIGIHIPIGYTSEYLKKAPPELLDLREAIHPKRAFPFTPKPYYQVFAQKHGFLPNLSILDLLFNMGNESRLFL